MMVISAKISHVKCSPLIIDEKEIDILVQIGEIQSRLPLAVLFVILLQYIQSYTLTLFLAMKEFCNHYTH